MPKYDLIEEEIKWCEAHRNPEQMVYQDGFIAGLQHALFLMRSRPTLRAVDVSVCTCKVFIPSPESTALKCANCGKPPRH